MLQLVLGSSGSGKTTELYKAVCDQVMTSSDGCMLVMPEQFSFETERHMLRQLGAKDSHRVEVTSFRRLSDLVYRRYGRPPGTVLSDGGRSVLMSLALESVAPQLTFYRTYGSGESLIPMLLSFEKELKLCGVSPSSFFEMNTMAEEETLRTKMQDIGLILSTYEALVAQSYVDPLDDLTRITPLLEENRFFDGYHIFLDGFKDFTVQETTLLRVMLRQAKTVTVALTTDGLYDTRDGLFAPSALMAKKLIRLAKEDGIPVAPHRTLSPDKRFRREALSHLERNLFAIHKERWEKEADDVRCFGAVDRQDEVSFVAEEICRLVQEEGYRYRDFAVIGRDLQPYRGLLDVAFDRHHIAYFWDNPRPVTGEMLIRMVLSAFRVLRTHYDTEAVLSYLKTGMVDGFSYDEISLLENYTYLWRISGKDWKAPWTRSPSGFSGTMTEEEQEQLSTLNQLRQRLIDPLIQFGIDTKDKNGREVSAAIYDLLLAVGADKRLLSHIDDLQGQGQFPLAEEQSRIWQVLMDTLDQMALLLHTTAVTRERYEGLLSLLLSQSEIGVIPAGMDQVSIGEAGRMRPAHPKVVFVIGVVQEEFPAPVTESGMFCDRERREMIDFGVPLVSTLDNLEADETFMAYTALTSAEERLYVTWYRTNLAGEEKVPSTLVREVRKILPQTPVLCRLLLPDDDSVWTKETAFSLYASICRRDTTLTSTLSALLDGDTEYTGRMEALERAVSGRPQQFISSDKAKKLFPHTMELSASQIEAFYRCAFSYFCQYGLRAKERKPAELSPLEYGSLMHYLLETLFGEVGHEALAAMDEDTLRKRVQDAILRYLEESMGGVEDKSQRFLFLFRRLAESAMVVISHIARELMQSEFRPIGYEMTLHKGGDFPPLTLSLSDGGTVCVNGVIDRVDVYEEGGKRFVRIIDYKTGSKEFRLSDVLSGMNMQMLIYLASLLETKQFQPAGILYMPSTRPMVSAGVGTSVEKINAAVDKKLRMNGLLLEDPSLVIAMEQTGAGRYVPATVKDGAVRSTASTVTTLQMEQVLSHVRYLVQEMGQQLHRGAVGDVPIKGVYDGCAYCPYFAVCGHEEDTGNLCSRFSKQEVLRQMEEREQEGDHHESMDNGTTKRH